MKSVDYDNLPQTLQRKALVRESAIELFELESGAFEENSLYLGVIHASDEFVRMRKSGAVKEFYQELADVYREIYGDAPWNEFLMCSDQECNGKKSITDVYGVLREEGRSLLELELLNPTDPREHRCPRCNSPMVFYYPSEKINSLIEREFSGEVVATVLFEHNGNAVGFSWAWFGDADMVSRKLSEQLRCSLDSQAIKTTRRTIAENRWQRVLFWNEWAIAPKYRKTICSLLLIGKLTFVGKARGNVLGEPDPYFLGTTLEGSSAHRFYSKFGMNTIFKDPDTRVVIITKPVQEGLDQYEEFEKMLTNREDGNGTCKGPEQIEQQGCET